MSDQSLDDGFTVVGRKKNNRPTAIESEDDDNTEQINTQIKNQNKAESLFHELKEYCNSAFVPIGDGLNIPDITTLLYPDAVYD